jgi:tRNA-Thr(GGU) m(6)t(6)A37 methyltransferase TsaA
MGKVYEIQSIGTVHVAESVFSIQLKKQYITGLTNIEGFSHLQILWWAHLADNKEARKTLVADKLFKKAPDKIGTFSTRSPFRPNPILLSTIKVTKIDFENGIIYTPFIDAEDSTPVIDIKPYFLMERVKNCKVPQWFNHWPAWYEDSMNFNWQDEINFK